MSIALRFLFAGFALLAAGAAHASSSAWFETQGGRVRLVTSGTADAEGRLTGALQIDLKPGWKTYWRDPGGSGVPPSIDVSGNPLLESATIDFPAPEHHSDGASTWAGYDQSVALPVTFQMRASGSPGLIEAAVFLGICETICIPVQATLSVDTASDANNTGDVAAVKAALAALPAPARPDFRAAVEAHNGKTVIFEVHVPIETPEIDLFVAGGDGYTLGQARAIPGEGTVVFAADIITRPKTEPAGPGLHYTLVTSDGAVAGYIPYF